MKTINKSKLDELIDIEKKYYETGKYSLLDEKFNVAKELSKEAFGYEDCWINFSDLINSIIGGGFSFKQDSTNEEIYEIFRILGYEVK